MKKVFLTAFVAAAFAFGMTSCNNNAPAEETTDSAVECCEHEHECCEHEHTCQCADTTCAQNNCEGCVNMGTENCCKAKAGEGACQGHEGCCEHQHEGCCEHAN